MYLRSLTWDRLVALNPTMSRILQSPPMEGLDYAWDDNNRLVGTSDALGCGKDIYYDPLGRVVGEDFSPCRASHAPYTPANPATGEDFEVLNIYDAYEPGQVQPDASVADSGFSLPAVSSCV